MRHRKEYETGEAFPARIGRKLGLAMGLGLFLVLLVGGISLFFSSSISRGTKAIKAVSDEIEHVNRLHTMMHHAVEVVQDAVMSGKAPLLEDAEVMFGNLNQEVAEYLAAEMALEDSPDKPRELEILQETIGVISSLADHSRKLADAVTRGRKIDPRITDRLAKLSRSGHDMFERVNGIHQQKMKRSIQASQANMKYIMEIYVAFALLGGLSLFLGRVIFSRTIVVPVQRLAAATVDVAAGDFGKRVAVTSKDEIGRLSHSFNVMAERLDQHERELRGVQEDLARKVRETEALYRLGMEISALLDLDKILTSVTEKAREVLDGETACLCLLDAEGHLVPRATAGPLGPGLPVEVIDPQPATTTSPIPVRLPEVGRARCDDHRLSTDAERQLTHIDAPLKMGGRSIGTLCVTARSPRSFSSREADLLRGLASQAAIAIENARLHEQVRILTLLEERERIAMDLHDGIIQSIYAVGLNLEGCAELVKDDSGEVGAQLERAVDDLNEVIKGIRLYISNLRPSSSDGVGLREAIADAVKVLKMNSSIETEIVEEGACGRMSHEQVGQLSRIAQEALTNVLKHARAGSVTVRLLSKDHHLVLSIRDDGVGFDSEAVKSTDGHGLRNMAERAKALGGHLSVKSARGSGTEIAVQIPLAWGNGKVKA